MVTVIMPSTVRQKRKRVGRQPQRSSRARPRSKAIQLQVCGSQARAQTGLAPPCSILLTAITMESRSEAVIWWRCLLLLSFTSSTRPYRYSVGPHRAPRPVRSCSLGPCLT